MKTVQDVRANLWLELEHWFPIQCREPYTDFSLFLILQKQKDRNQDTGLLICRGKPNSNHMIVGKLRKGLTIEQNFSTFANLLNKMPCLTVEIR